MRYILIALLIAPFAAYADSFVSMDQVTTSTIVQHGNRNIAVTEQGGRSNDIDLNQTGNNNTATVRQTGSGDVVNFAQRGNGLGITITQTGSNAPRVTVTQHGR
jgi:hypothetical protein